MYVRVRLGVCRMHGQDIKKILLFLFLVSYISPLFSPVLPQVDFNVQVLTQNAWPFGPQFTVNLPQSLLRCIERFNTFYSVRWPARSCEGPLVGEKS